LLVVGCLALIAAGRAGAVTSLVNDDFSAGLGGWYFYNTGNGSAAWGAATAPANSAPLSGNVMRNQQGSASNTSGIIQWSDVTLGVGDSLQVSLNFMTTAAVTTTSSLSLNLLGGVSTFSSNQLGTGATPFTNATGYNFTTSLNNSGTSFRDTSPNTTGTPGTGVSTTGAQPVTSSPAIVMGDGTAHTLVFTLTRAANGMQISASIDGNAYSLSGSTVYLDPNSLTTTFDTLMINDSTNGMPSGYSLIDNVSVTLTTVPEPPAILLMGGGLLLVLAASVRRLRRGAAVL
ncbi:MAG TPA: hypothetical protein VIM58_00020, partial [Candidatus Methylacidiphilales bacterium]